MKKIILYAILGTFLAGSAYAAFNGNVESKIFHRPSCRWFNCKSCTRRFSTYQQAIDAGYRPCKVCKPRP